MFIFIFRFTCVHTYLTIHVYICLYVCIYLYKDICKHVVMYMCRPRCRCSCLCICICICNFYMYLYVYLCVSSTLALLRCCLYGGFGSMYLLYGSQRPCQGKTRRRPVSPVKDGRAAGASCALQLLWMPHLEEEFALTAVYRPHTMLGF